MAAAIRSDIRRIGWPPIHFSARSQVHWLGKAYGLVAKSKLIWLKSSRNGSLFFHRAQFNAPKTFSSSVSLFFSLLFSILFSSILFYSIPSNSVQFKLDCISVCRDWVLPNYKQNSLNLSSKPDLNYPLKLIASSGGGLASISIGLSNIHWPLRNSYRGLFPL